MLCPAHTSSMCCPGRLLLIAAQSLQRSLSRSLSLTGRRCLSLFLGATGCHSLAVAVAVSVLLLALALVSPFIATELARARGAHAHMPFDDFSYTLTAHHCTARCSANESAVPKAAGTVDRERVWSIQG